MGPTLASIFFFFNDTATTEIYTLSLHDALPISAEPDASGLLFARLGLLYGIMEKKDLAIEANRTARSEEHTSELQSQSNLVCRLLLEKKNKVRASRLAEHDCHAVGTRSTLRQHH